MKGACFFLNPRRPRVVRTTAWKRCANQRGLSHLACLLAGRKRWSVAAPVLRPRQTIPVPGFKVLGLEVHVRVITMPSLRGDFRHPWTRILAMRLNSGNEFIMTNLPCCERSSTVTQQVERLPRPRPRPTGGREERGDKKTRKTWTDGIC